MASSSRRRSDSRGNQTTGVRRDMNAYPNYRTPSREVDLANWHMIRDQVFHGWELGLSSLEMTRWIQSQLHANQWQSDRLAPSTVRGYFQRIYNELGLGKKGRPGRSPSAALYEAYRTGIRKTPERSPARSGRA